MIYGLYSRVLDGVKLDEISIYDIMDLLKYDFEQNALRKGVSDEVEYIRSDIFCEGSHSNIVHLLKDSDGYFICDRALDPLSAQYEKILPLFVREDKESKDYERVTIKYGSDFFVKEVSSTYSDYSVDAYLTVNDGRFGIIDHNGKMIVPLRYQSISPYAIGEYSVIEAEPYKSESSCDKICQTAFYICKRLMPYEDNDLDVYDINGNLIFSDICDLRTCEETNVYPEPSCSYYENVTEDPNTIVKSIYVNRYQNEFDRDVGVEVCLDNICKYSIDSLTSKIVEPENENDPVQRAVVDLTPRCRHITFPFRANAGFDFQYPDDLQDTLNEMLCGLKDLRATSDILDVDVGEFDIDVFTFNRLNRMNIHTVGEALSLDASDILNNQRGGMRIFMDVERVRSTVRHLLRDDPVCEMSILKPRDIKKDGE